MPQNQFIDYGRQQARSLALLAQQGANFRGMQLRADLANAETKRREAESLGRGLSSIGGAMAEYGKQRARNKALDDYLASDAYKSLGPEDQAAAQAQVAFARTGQAAPPFISQLTERQQSELRMQEDQDKYVNRLEYDIAAFDAMEPRQQAAHIDRMRATKLNELEFYGEIADAASKADLRAYIAKQPYLQEDAAIREILSSDLGLSRQKEMLRLQHDNRMAVLEYAEDAWDARRRKPIEEMMTAAQQAEAAPIKNLLRRLDDAVETGRVNPGELQQERERLLGKLQQIEQSAEDAYYARDEFMYTPAGAEYYVENGQKVFTKATKEEMSEADWVTAFGRIATAFEDPKDARDTIEWLREQFKGQVGKGRKDDQINADMEALNRVLRAGKAGTSDDTPTIDQSGMSIGTPAPPPPPPAITNKSAEAEYRAYREIQRNRFSPPGGWSRMTSEQQEQFRAANKAAKDAWENKIPTRQEYEHALQIQRAGKAASKDARAWADHIYKRWHSSQKENLDKIKKGEPIKLSADADLTPYVGQVIEMEGEIGKYRIDIDPQTGQERAVPVD